MKNLFLIASLLLLSNGIVAQSKIAVVDTKKLIDTLPQKKQVVAELEHMNKTAEEELNNMRATIDKMVGDYKLHEKEWSESIRLYEQQRIQKKQQDLEQYAREADERINNYSMVKQQELFLIVKAAVQMVVEKKGYDVVLEVNNTVFSKAPDLTNEVAAILVKQ